MVNSGQIAMAFASAAGGVASALNYDREALSDYYNSMVSVAAADGVIEQSERELLNFLKTEWGI
jgi:tellurite resistance protein